MEEIQNLAWAACARFDEELAAHLEGETNPFIVSHSQGCASCGAVLADIDSVRRAAQHLPQEEPSPAVWAKLRSRLEADGLFETSGCRQFGGELPAFLEGEPHPFIRSHARDCRACGTMLADLQSIQQAARELPETEPSPAVWAKLRTRLEFEGLLANPLCAQFDGDLAAFLEGENQPFVLAHAAACGPCGAMLADLQSIQQAARELPLEEPSRVVWANVRARLEAEGAFGAPMSLWRQILAGRIFPHAVPVGVLAALVFLGLAFTIPSTNPLRLGGGEELADSQGPTLRASVMSTGQDGAVADVVSDLESSFRANESSMAPELKATYEKSLVSLDGSIRECLESLQQEPRNTLAHDYLLTAYRSKAEVLSSALESEGR